MCCVDVVQGAVLLVGSIVFLIIQKVEFGGLPTAALYWRDPANASQPNVALMQKIPPASTIVAYFDFVFKVRRGRAGGSSVGMVAVLRVCLGRSSFVLHNSLCLMTVKCPIRP
jgi:hypothetical protein